MINIIKKEIDVEESLRKRLEIKSKLMYNKCNFKEVEKYESINKKRNYR